MMHTSQKCRNKTSTNRLLNFSLFFIILAYFLFSFFCSNAKALSLQVENSNASPGDVVSVNVSLVNYDQEQIAGAVFTLTYNADYLTLVEVNSTYFDTFSNQWQLLTPVPDPLPPTSVVVDGRTYTSPLNDNTIDSSSLKKTLVAGVRVKSGTPSDLLTFTFKVDQAAPPAIFPVSIQPTIIKSTSAGYSTGGEVIPILSGWVEGEPDPAKAYPTYSPLIVNGSIVVKKVFLDSDMDGIDDIWEMAYFGNLHTANKTRDFDKDGYSDLQEYLNSIANDIDPNGDVYHPNTINTPGGTGYNPLPAGNSNFWNLILPGILNSAKTQK